MNSPFVRKSEYGRLLVTVSRSPFYIKTALRLAGCNGIAVNGMGRFWKDLLYLREIPQIDQFELHGFALNCLDSLNGLGAQSQLKSISLDLQGKCKIDWTGFPKLRKIFTENCFVTPLLWRCNDLDNLTLATCSEPDWQNISLLQGLNHVAVIRGGMSNLNGLSIENLKSLEIHHNKNLVSVGENRHLPNLESLLFTHCKKLNNLSGIGRLQSLKKIGFEDCGTLDSLSPILDLEQLEEIWFFGTRIADGKIKKILSMPSLKLIGFDDHGSYDIGLKESLLALNVPKMDWPLMLREPKKWSKLTQS